MHYSLEHQSRPLCLRVVTYVVMAMFCTLTFISIESCVLLFRMIAIEAVAVGFQVP
jgi:hypothetical protein